MISRSVPAAWPSHLVAVLPDALDGASCDQLVALLSTLRLTDGVVGRGADEAPVVDASVRRVRQAVVPRAAAAAVYERVADVVKECNRTSFGFDLDGLSEDLVLVEYGPGDFYNWHLDLGPDEQARKLSVSISLSSPADYDGGALTFPGREVRHPPRGGAVVFPSFLLHGVQPVTSGCRRALLAWVAGPRFR